MGEGSFLPLEGQPLLPLQALSAHRKRSPEAALFVSSYGICFGSALAEEGGAGDQHTGQDHHDGAHVDVYQSIALFLVHFYILPFYDFCLTYICEAVRPFRFFMALL